MKDINNCILSSSFFVEKEYLDILDKYSSLFKELKTMKENLDTGMVFNSVNGAGKYYGKEKNHHINECCQGKRRTALGYRWQYME